MASKNTSKIVRQSSPFEQWYGKNRAWAWLLSTLIAVATAVVTLYVGILPHLEKDQDRQIENQVNASLKEPLEKVQNLRDDIAGLKGEWESIKPLLQSRVQENLKHSASLTPSEFEKELPNLRATMLAASNAKIMAAPQLVAEVGQRAVQVAARGDHLQESAWLTVGAFMDYRSIVNQAFVPPDSNFQTTPQTRYMWSIGHGHPDRVGHLGTLPIDKAATIRELGTAAKSSSQTGDALLLGVGGKFKIDGLELRNVILKNMIIVYQGGALMLENVVFVNCKFEVSTDQHGQSFASAVLGADSVKFSAS